MKRAFLLASIILSTSLLATEEESRPKDTDTKESLTGFITVPASTLLIKKLKHRRKRKTHSWTPILPREPIYGVYLGNVAFENHLCKIQGREAFLTVHAISTGPFNCHINIKKLIGHSGPLSSREEPFKLIKKGEQMTVELPQCIICESQPSQYASAVCGHLCMCKECSERISPKKCPICRQSAEKIIKIYGR